MSTETFIIVITITVIFWASVLFLSVLYKLLYSLISSEYFKRTVFVLSLFYYLLSIKCTKKAVETGQKSSKCSKRNYSYISKKPDINSNEYVKINKTRSYHDYSSDEESYEKSYERKNQNISLN